MYNKSAWCDKVIKVQSSRCLKVTATFSTNLSKNLYLNYAYFNDELFIDVNDYGMELIKF